MQLSFSYGERPFCFITGGQRNPISFKEVRGAAAAAKGFTSSSLNFRRYTSALLRDGPEKPIH